MLAGLGQAPVPNQMDLTTVASTGSATLARGIDERLGLPVPASRSATRVVDAASGQAVDEVTDLDAAGTPVAITRFDLGGNLVSSIRLGYQASAGAAVTSAVAGLRAASIAGGLGIQTAGSPIVTARATGGWVARWVRLVGEVPVPGDGVTVQLTANGAFHALARTEHSLAPAPATSINQARARILAGARLDAWFSGALHGQATIASIAQAWVAPNDTFGDPLPAGSAGALRLAWIVRVTTKGALADRLAGLELAFDAGDGSPLGGDLVE